MPFYVFFFHIAASYNPICLNLKSSFNLGLPLNNSVSSYKSFNLTQLNPWQLFFIQMP